MDHLELFLRTDTCKSMVLVDGHGSRFGLDLLGISMITLICGKFEQECHIIPHYRKLETAKNRIGHIT